ncbi:MAG TPA: hypothetical protein PL041_06825, partial [Melioribacteraceae bacterium]|nr:hypothetical protein [Melioribacteraceae bacterium]
MKSKILLVMSLVFFISSLNAQSEKDSTKKCNYNISGGTARVLSLGNSRFLEDVSDVFLNSAYGSKYTNVVWGDIGDGINSQVSGNNHNIGANISLSDNFTLGALLTNGITNKEFSIASLSNLISMDNDYIQNNIRTIKFRNNISLFASYKLNNITYGLGVSYFVNNSDEDFKSTPIIDSEYKLNQMGFNAGALITLFNNYKLDVSGTVILNGLQKDQFEYKYDIDRISTSIIVRSFIPTNKQTTIIPLIQYSHFSDDAYLYNKLSNKKENTTSTQNYLLIGVGSNYSKGSLLITGGVSLSFGS